MRWFGAVIFLAACSFDAAGTFGSSDPRGDASANVDAPIVTPDAGATSIPHVPPNHDSTGTGSFTLTESTIDTDAMTITGPAIPAGVTFETSLQNCATCPELAILRVNELDVPSGNTIHVEGARPLVILAAGRVNISGIIDASGRGPTPGAGGAGPALGMGAGAAGVHSSSFSDSGGGGAGFASSGAKGGDGMGEMTSALGGMGGSQYGDPMIIDLIGGSGGGAGSGGDCPASPGGGGGGAVQIYSATSITIVGGGGINVGGGGGGGGPGCASTSGGGSGGGSGGALFLMAPTITNEGFLAANGGGGGGGGSAGSMGGHGEHGQLSSTAAVGGSAAGSYGGAGGVGATGTTEPGAGMPMNTWFGGNGGAGGGAVGRIRALYRTEFNGGMTSPAIVADTY